MATKPRPRATPGRCANCGGDVSNRGPRPADDRRYCMKEGCQAVKYRRRHEARKPSYRDEWAPKECSCCGRELPERRKRRNDSPAGRWCQRKECQDHRASLERAQGVANAQARIESATLDGDFLREAVRRTLAGDPPFEECPNCGGHGLTGWIHPMPQSPRTPCEELGKQLIRRITAEMLSSSQMQ